jgi:crotonobetaine/carnitine-CoA ligase
LAGVKILLADNTASELEGPLFYSELLASEPLQPAYEEMFYGDTCAILWTSGTTGKSKGVMQSYNAWICAIQEGASRFYNSIDGDIMYCVLPLYNSGAWITSILRALLEGITVVIEPKFSVHAFWDRIRHFGATQTFAIGAMGVFLLNSPARDDDADNPLRVAQIVPMPADRWQEFEQRFGVELLRSGLGQSECLSVTRQLGNPENIPPHSIGFPNPALDVALLDDEGKPVADGETGELAVKPKQPYLIFNGYFDDEEATSKAYHGDWYRTGDLARKDPATGAYYFADRKKDAIRYGGRNISTLEVESVAIRHPAVKEVAAYGITCAEVDSEQELKLSVVVEPGQGFECEQLCAFINANAPYYFVPRFIQVVESLPYTPTNKLQKFKLREAGNDENTWDLKRSSYRVER